MRFIKTFGLICAAALLTQCSLFSPAPYSATNTYELTPACGPMTGCKVDKVIYVMPMQSYPGLKTANMRYTLQKHEVNYFSKNKWVAAPASMLQVLMVNHLQQRFSRVTTLQSDKTDIILKTTLLKFQQEFCGAQSQFHLCMKVEAINAKTHKVISLHNIDMIVPAPTANPYGGVIAANKATTIALQHINNLVLHAC